MLCPSSTPQQRFRSYCTLNDIGIFKAGIFFFPSFALWSLGSSHLPVSASGGSEVTSICLVKKEDMKQNLSCGWA